MEAREKEKTGIKNLRIRFNKVFGYYIEISKANLAHTPEDYIRKQTLTNGERFITPELKEMESRQALLAKEELERKMKNKKLIKILLKVFQRYYPHL